MNYLPPDINFLNLEVTSVFFVIIVSGLLLGLVLAFYAMMFEWFWKH